MLNKNVHMVKEHTETVMFYIRYEHLSKLGLPVLSVLSVANEFISCILFNWHFSWNLNRKHSSYIAHHCGIPNGVVHFQGV